MDTAAKMRVLVVDDEPAVRRFVHRILDGEGLQVLELDNAKAAVRAMETEEFALVVSDLCMPELSGLQLLEHIRKQRGSLPVILMAAHPTLDSTMEALQLQAFRFLRKPFVREEFLREVRQALVASRVLHLQKQAMEFFEGSQRKASERQLLEQRFEHALEGLFFAFQPVVHFSERRVHGYEALVRSREPSLAGPEALFRAAEQLGKLDALSACILERLPRAFQSAPREALLFANIMPEDLSDDRLLDPKISLGTFAHRTVLEITEHSPLENVGEVRARLQRLRKQGFRVAIDDLGSGYASLTSFAQLEPQIAKLDMVLVRDLHKNALKRQLCQALVAVCGQLGVQVIAEGIETPEELQTLRAFGVDYFQGYLFGKPSQEFLVPEQRFTEH